MNCPPGVLIGPDRDVPPVIFLMDAFVYNLDSPTGAVVMSQRLLDLHANSLSCEPLHKSHSISLRDTD